MSQRIYADLYIRIMEQILHKKEKSKIKSKKVHGITLPTFIYTTSLYVPTLPYLMSSTSKKTTKVSILRYL